MPRPGSKIEKSKDFKGSMKKILISLKPWHLVIGISIFLAMVGSIISLIAPNKLSDLTDYITEGLKPNINENTMTSILTDSSINPVDANKFYQFLEQSKDMEQEQILKEKYWISKCDR